MSKRVSDMLAYIEERGAEPTFQLFALAVTIDAGGQVEGQKWVAPISQVQFDANSSECLLHIEDGEPPINRSRLNAARVTLADVLSMISPANREYAVCTAQEAHLDDARVRIDTPIIGFGENPEERRYFVVVLGDRDRP